MKWIPGSSPISFPGLGIEINPPKGFGNSSIEIAFYGGYFPLKGKEFRAYKRIAARLMGESAPIPKLSKI